MILPFQPTDSIIYGLRTQLFFGFLVHVIFSEVNSSSCSLSIGTEIGDLERVMAVTLRYFPEFGKLALQKTICGAIYARVYCIFSACTMSS